MDAFALFTADLDIANQWSNIIVAALIAAVGYLSRGRFAALDQRHQRAEDHMEDLEDKAANHETRITVIEDRHERRS